MVATGHSALPLLTLRLLILYKGKVGGNESRRFCRFPMGMVATPKRKSHEMDANPTQIRRKSDANPARIQRKSLTNPAHRFLERVYRMLQLCYRRQEGSSPSPRVSLILRALLESMPPQTRKALSTFLGGAAEAESQSTCPESSLEAPLREPAHPSTSRHRFGHKVPRGWPECP